MYEYIHCAYRNVYMYTYVCTCIVYDQILFCKLGSHNNPRLQPILVRLPSLFIMNLLYIQYYRFYV